LDVERLRLQGLISLLCRPESRHRKESLKFATPGPSAGTSHPTKSGDFVEASARDAKPATRSVEASAWLQAVRWACRADQGTRILEPRSRARTMVTLLWGGGSWSFLP
jgi:hypothetical protein